MTYFHKTILSAAKSLTMAAVFFVALSATAPAAQAQYDYYTPVDDYYTPVDDYYTSYDGGDYYTPVTNDYYTPVYDYYTPVQSGYYTPGYTYDNYGYDSYGYDSSGYYLPGYTYGSSYYTPGYTYDSGPAYVQPTYVQPTSVVQPSYTTETNTLCSGTNNCNTTYNPAVVQPTPVSVVVDNNNTNTNNNANTNNNVITINTPAPTVTTIVKERERSRQNKEYRQPTYYQPPMYNSSTPYVSLSAVPYTGLELGFYGTVIYWSVLVLWCLFVAYMIVVKQAHIKMARWFKTFLFGGTAAVAATEVTTPVKREVVQAPTQTLDKTDDFIMAQILRRA